MKDGTRYEWAPSALTSPKSSSAVARLAGGKRPRNKPEMHGGLYPGSRDRAPEPKGDPKGSKKKQVRV